MSLGGLVFNIGNVGGAATGFNIVFGFPLKVGTVVAGVIGILIFLSKDAKNFMDKLTKYLGSIMIVTVLYVAFRSKPPVVEAISSVGHLNEFPNLVFPIITLLGGKLRRLHHILRCTSSSGCRFLRNQDLPHVRRSVLMGVSVSGVMRILLFLAVLGVVTATPEVVGSEAWVASPPAAAFKAGAGIIGYKIFGLVILFAAITSIIGAAYTSVSFLKTLHPFIMENEKWFVIGFIAVSTVIMTLLGQPATLLVLAGSVNGLILPITLLVILLASRRKEYRRRRLQTSDRTHRTWRMCCSSDRLLRNQGSAEDSYHLWLMDEKGEKHGKIIKTIKRTGARRTGWMSTQMAGLWQQVCRVFPCNWLVGTEAVLGSSKKKSRTGRRGLRLSDRRYI